MANPPSLSLPPQRALPPLPDAKSPLRPQVSAARLPGKTATLIQQRQQVSRSYLPRELRARLAAEPGASDHQPVGAQQTVALAVKNSAATATLPLGPMPSGPAAVPGSDAPTAQRPTQTQPQSQSRPSSAQVRAHLTQLAPVQGAFKSYVRTFNNELRDQRTLSTMNYLHGMNHGGVAEFAERAAMGEEGRLRTNFKAEFKAQVAKEAQKLERQPNLSAAAKRSALKNFRAGLKERLTEKLRNMERVDIAPLQRASETIGPFNGVNRQEEDAVKEAMERMFSSHLQLLSVLSVGHRNDSKAKAIAALEKTLDEKLELVSRRRSNGEGALPIVVKVKAKDIGGRLAVEIFTRLEILLQTYEKHCADLDSPDFEAASRMRGRTVTEIREQIESFPIKLEMTIELLLQAAQSDAIKNVPDARSALSELAYALQNLKVALEKPLQRVLDVVDAPVQDVVAHRALTRRTHSPDRAAAKAAWEAVQRTAAPAEKALQPLTASQHAKAA
ncbi:MAG: hypothetical protein IBJ04_11185 [Hydrogenophaga sp.]|uniref:hypothetical protein n=1 Tax=Hydrogenophaga sp. TaxID=1904254 RepID=UPI00257A2915|nr:hypothetical protein [Hydrogenophaga sp.]MBL0944880.1 hypothetical protein [Hydrogenophaga sp.]